MVEILKNPQFWILAAALSFIIYGVVRAVLHQRRYEVEAALEQDVKQLLQNITATCGRIEKMVEKRPSKKDHD